MAVGAGDLPSQLRIWAWELLKYADQLEEIPYEDQLMNRVCAAYHVKREQLLSPSRIQPLATARQVWMYLLRKETRLSYPAIGKLMQREHATVMSGVRKVERQMLEQPLFARMVETLRISEGRQQERAALAVERKRG